MRFESLKPRIVLAVEVFSVDESQSITEVPAEVSAVASDADGGHVEAASESPTQVSQAELFPGSGSLVGDTNGDWLLQPIDVLIIINAIDAGGSSTLLVGDPLDVKVDGLLTIDDASLAMTNLVASLAIQSQSPPTIANEEASAVQPALEPQEIYYDSSSQSESEALEASTSSALNYDSTPSPSYAPTPSPTPPPLTPSTAPCPSCSPPADGTTEAIGWDIPIGLSAGLNGVIDGLKTKIGSNVLTTHPFAGVPDDFQLPIIVPFYGVASTPSIPVPGAVAIRSWTIEDLIDFYLAPYISVVSGVDYAMGVEVIATRDPMIVGCGCNMKTPQIASVGPPISLSGMFTFDVGATVKEVDFNDTHRYPRKDPNGYGPAHPYYSGDPGNLVDEVVTVIVTPEIRLGINMTIPFIGTAINEEFKLEMITVQQQIKCSEGTPLRLASPAPAPPNLP